MTIPPFILPPCTAGGHPWAGPVVDIGRALHRFCNRRDTTWAGSAPSLTQQREDDNFERFLAGIASFPGRLAAAFGFKSAVIVCDHFDVVSREVPLPNLFAVFWDAIRASPFFASALREEALMELFAQFRTRITPASRQSALMVPNINIVPERRCAVDVPRLRGSVAL
jgi:hypothetical protein